MLTEIALGDRIMGDLFFYVCFSNFQIVCDMHTSLQNKTNKNYKKINRMIKNPDLHMPYDKKGHNTRPQHDGRSGHTTASISKEESMKPPNFLFIHKMCVNTSEVER